VVSHVNVMVVEFPLGRVMFTGASMIVVLAYAVTLKVSIYLPWFSTVTLMDTK